MTATATYTKNLTVPVLTMSLALRYPSLVTCATYSCDTPPPTRLLRRLDQSDRAPGQLSRRGSRLPQGTGASP
jgi:hypothetical protein